MPDPSPFQAGYVESGDRRVYFEAFGTGTRDTVCLLNGLAMSTRSWYGFLPRLTDEFDVLLWDYEGQGSSSSDDVPYSIPGLADHLARILDRLSLERIHLLGISYGGFVALDFARLHQQRLHTLTLSGILLTHEALFRMYEDLSLRFYRGTPEVFELYTHYMYEKIFGESFVREYSGSLEKMRTGFHDRFRDRRHCLVRLTEAQSALLAALDGNLPGYRAIRTPTLIVAGEHDRVIPPHVQRKMCGILPSTRFELMPDSGHVVYLEQPDLFFGLLTRFMRTRSLAC